MRSSYYNENDPYAAQWLRNLIDAGHIAPGDVDERSIVDVRPDDLRGYRQCHFFAGIGGWSIALRLAGWDRPVWTGSCPCQPFSAAGKGKAADDERHLWPRWFSLIRECRPATIFGEQVEAAIGWGWLDAVFNDLEKEGYACGATVLPAVGAPHIRNRLWFVGHANGTGCRAFDAKSGTGETRSWSSMQSGLAGPVADSDGARRRAGRPGEAGERKDAPRVEPSGLCDAGELGRRRVHEYCEYGSCCFNANECDANDCWLLKHPECVPTDWESEDGEFVADAAKLRREYVPPIRGSTRTSETERRLFELAGSRPAFWSDLEWLACTDGKTRPTQPGLHPLAHGVRNRASQLRAYGNAIVPQTAAQFIRAMM